MLRSASTITSLSASAEIYDPASNLWTAAAPLREARYAYVLALLPNGQVTINVSVAVFTGGPLPATEIVLVSSVGGFTVPVTP